MIRKSYNAAHAEWVARIRAQNPQLAALWGHDVLPPATNENEEYARAECLDARPSGVKGRGED